MNTVTVNGKIYNLPAGKSVSIIDGKIFVDGQIFNECGPLPEVTLTIRGDIENLKCDRSVNMTGTIRGNVQAGGSVNCDDVGGSVQAGGSVSCDDVGGSVTAGRSVSCDDVSGSVNARGSVNRG